MATLPNLEAVRILCVGDIMLDRFIQGNVNRISPESPVPIIHLKHTQSVPGGAANVARNIASLGGHCTLIGVVGDDAAGRELIRELAICGGITPLPVIDGTRPTIEKTRFISQGQHLLRADREEPGAVSATAARAIVEAAREQLGDHDVLVLSDYAKGVLTDAVISDLIQLARRADIPIVVDPKSEQLKRYSGATILTPNATEAAAATGVDVQEDAGAELGGRIALDRAEIDAILITRAERGMSLVTRKGTLHVPASAHDVFDVVGAGDTVVATLALCIGARLSMEDAARIANAAAGIVVGKPGTATTSRSELLDELSRFTGADIPSPVAKLLSRDGAVAQRVRFRRSGLRVGFAHGWFDILHIGHVRALEYARSQCDRLIVGLAADATAATRNGHSRPVNSEADRAQFLGAFAFIDNVFVFVDETPQQLIDELRPDVLIRGADHKVGQIVQGRLVSARGGRVLTFEPICDHGSTALFERDATQSGALA